jgi:hypothetical protein
MALLPDIMGGGGDGTRYSLMCVKFPKRVAK